MTDFSVHGKRFYPEPCVSFPRLEKPPSPVHFSLPALAPSLAASSSARSPPPVRPMTAPPNLSKPRMASSSVPLPGIPHLANYMLNNRVPFQEIDGNIPAELGLSKCRSSKDLIESAKQFSAELTVNQISQICNLRDRMFEQGGAYVFTPEQFVQFYGFYNMFLTEERSWEPRLSEKFYNSSRTRLRCSCRWSPRLNKRARTEDNRGVKHKCSAVYDMSFWPLHKLVIWECIESPNHDMNINASISSCQYMENLVQKMKTFNPQDIEIMIKAQLAPLSHRLFLNYLDSDKVRGMLRSKEEPTTKAKEPDLSADLVMAAKLTSQCASPDIFSSLVTLKYTRALILLHKDVFRSMFYSDTLTISTNYRVSLHFDKISMITITNADGRHGASVFLPFDETSNQFEELLHLCLRQIEQIGNELYGSSTPNYVGLANVRKVVVSLGSQRKIERLNRQITTIEKTWARCLENYECELMDISRFDKVQDKEIADMLRASYASPTVKQGEETLLSAIRLAETRQDRALENFLRTQFQHYHKWSTHRSRWAVEVGDASTCYDQLIDLPFNFKHSLVASVLQFTSWLAQSSIISPKPVVRHRIALSSVLCSPPPSDDY